jgi:predicted RNA-binding protein with RPS1 domain
LISTRSSLHRYTLLKVTLTQSLNGRLLRGWILIRIETPTLCTQIWSSCIFDPYEELYIWMGKIKDFQYPARMIIDEEGYGVELIAEPIGGNVLFRIEPWLRGQSTLLQISLEHHVLIQSFHEGIVEFVKNDYQNTEWSHIDNLSYQNWDILLQQSNTQSSQWQKRLALYGYRRGRALETEYSSDIYKLTQEQQLLMTLREALLKITTLAANNHITEAYALSSLYKNLPVDFILGEVEPDWYRKCKDLIEQHCELPAKIKYWKSTKRTHQYADVRFKTLRVGQLIDGRVFKIKSYGLFVDIGGYHAILHISQISQLPVDNLEKIFRDGDWIRAMIIWMNQEKGRVALSTSDLEPEAGDMLKDPLVVYTNAEAMANRYHQNVLSKLSSSAS